jgi:hypothetical protein
LNYGANQLKKYNLRKNICIKCNNNAKFFKTWNATFIGFDFKSDWYLCNKCGFIFPKILEKELKNDKM